METSPTDHELIARHLKDGDEEALRLLFSRHSAVVHAFLVRFTGSVSDAEDMAQEAFVKAWKSLARVDAARSFRTWLMRITRNVAIDWLRRRKTTPFTDLEDDEGRNAVADALADDADLPDVALDRKDAVAAVRAAIAALPPQQREVLLLRHDGELSFAEIGEALGEPLNTVKSRYRRAVLELKKRLSAA
jgi:RNA polymerase sigma-70 factor (ECF subfamily)